MRITSALLGALPEGPETVCRGLTWQRWTYLAEVAPGVCWSGVWGREREYEDTENSLVDTGLRGAFCKHPFTAEILNLVQEMT